MDVSFYFKPALILVLVASAAGPARGAVLAEELKKAATRGFPFVVVGTASQKAGVSPVRSGDSFLVISQVNPYRDRDKKLKGFFGETEHRPATWKEADQTCKKLGWHSLDWSLPTLTELQKLNKVGLDFLLSNPRHASGLASHLAQRELHGGQFQYLWTKERDAKLPEGLRIAFNPYKRLAVHHTEQKPLQFICVSTMKQTSSLSGDFS